MAENKKDFLGNLMGTPYPPLRQQRPQLVKEKSEYCAFDEFTHRKGMRFRIVDADGKSYGCSYAHLLEWEFDPPTLLTITTATRIFTLQGNYLERIEQLLMEDKVKALHIFNAAHYDQPEADQPVIASVTIATP